MQNNIASLEERLVDIEARRQTVNEHATRAAARLAQARDDHAAHIAAIVAGKASPDAPASSLRDAEASASIAQQAVQAVEAEYEACVAELRHAKHAALVAARDDDIKAAKQLAAEVDDAAEALNAKYQAWLDASNAILETHDNIALTGGEFKPFGEAHPGALLASVLHPDVETVNRLNIIAPRGKTLAERFA